VDRPFSLHHCGQTLLFTPLWTDPSLYTTVDRPSSLHHCGQTLLFTPLWTDPSLYTTVDRPFSLHYCGQTLLFTPLWTDPSLYTTVDRPFSLRYCGQTLLFTPLWTDPSLYTTVDRPFSPASNAGVGLNYICVKISPIKSPRFSKCSRKGYLTIAQDGGKVVSFAHRPLLPPGNTPGTHFC